MNDIMQHLANGTAAVLAPTYSTDRRRVMAGEPSASDVHAINCNDMLASFVQRLYAEEGLVQWDTGKISAPIPWSNKGYLKFRNSDGEGFRKCEAEALRQWLRLPVVRPALLAMRNNTWFLHLMAYPTAEHAAAWTTQMQMTGTSYDKMRSILAFPSSRGTTR